MPGRDRLIAWFGNGLVALFFGAGFFFEFGKGNFGGALLCLGPIALAVFNIYVIEKSARLLSEEAWLASQVRKAELRQKLKSMGVATEERSARG